MAIKKRTLIVEPLTKDITAEQIEKFASGADGGVALRTETNKTAIRNYKGLRVPFNQYEYEQLEIGARLSGRSKLNFIRYAMLQMAKALQLEEV